MIATFTLAAHEPETNTLAIITASNFLAVGSLVPWINSQAGLVVSQSFANPDAAGSALESMLAGKTPAQAIDDYLIADDLAAARQVGIMNSQGEVALYDGPNCTPAVESIAGDGFMVLGNMLVPGTCRAVAEAFSAAKQQGTELGTAMLKAMFAGQDYGGDKRGKLAAALLMKRAGQGYLGGSDTFVDLRVDASARPLAQLRDLYSLFKLYNPQHFDYHMLPISQLNAADLRILDELLQHLSGQHRDTPRVTLEDSHATAELLAAHNLAANFDAEKRAVSSLLLSETAGFFRLTAL